MADNNETNELSSLDGVGPATIKKLKSLKITTVAGLSKASQKSLEGAGIAASTAKKMISAAKVASKASSATKKTVSATKKVGTSAKKAGKSASSATKKTAQKVSEASSKAVAKSKDVAKKVVEDTKETAASLKQKSSADRKGTNISIPKSVKDMPWFKKKD
ncbi:MAG: helix-hairpin-helix domain-containing protein [Candidatus Poseidoniales archaeon]